MAEVMRNRGYNKKKLSIDLSGFDLTDFNNNNFNNYNNSYASPKSTKSSPNRFESPKGVGILAALSSNNINNKSTVLAISPRFISSNPIPILSNSPKPINKNQQQQQPSIEEMEMCEEYTCVISHAAGSNLVRKREYFDDRFLGNGYHKATAACAAVVAASAPVEAFRTADFLNACSFCHKQLHGLDIFMYRGEKAFCSTDCRCKQISIDEHKEKCGSGAMKSPEFSASPCSQFSAGVAVA